MKKIKNYIKNSTWISKIFIYAWFVMIFLFSFGFIFGHNKDDIKSDISLLLTLYTAFSSMFLMPAITLNQALKKKNSNSISQKSWSKTLLLSLFLGPAGGHRFYTGRTFSAVLYMFTMGGFGLGFIVDIILILLGKFTDSNGNTIKWNSSKVISNSSNVIDIEKQDNNSVLCDDSNNTVVNDNKNSVVRFMSSKEIHEKTSEKIVELHKKQIQRHLQLIEKSSKTLMETTDPYRFFSSYDIAVQSLKRINDLSETLDADSASYKFEDFLINKKETLFNLFIDRCYEANVLETNRDTILSYKSHLTEDNIGFINLLLEDNTSEIESSNFADVVVMGEEEKKQAIPLKNITNNEDKEVNLSSGITLKIKTKIVKSSDDKLDLEFDFDDETSYYSHDFLEDMSKYEKKVVSKATFVPFKQYWPTYDSMDISQRNWYFYWRNQVRNSNYIDTDLSYIFVHIYELLSGFGWDNPQDGYNQLIALWQNYRSTYVQIDGYLIEWLFDFCELHNIEFNIPQEASRLFSYNQTKLDLLIDKYSNNTPLKLPFVLIGLLSDYSIVRSKFYNDGHQELMHEAIPRVISLADAVLIKKTGKGILETYGPNRTRKQSYYMFRSANCKYSNKSVNVSVKAYSSSPKLRSYIYELVRYAENVLREIYDYRGRLRAISLNDETASLVRNFLTKEYSLKKKANITSKTVDVKLNLNFDSINELRSQSDFVRDALEVTEDSNEKKELLTDLEPIKELFTSLQPYCRNLIDNLQTNSWSIKYDPSIQVTIDKINELAIKQIACSVLVVEGDTLILEDDYIDEFSYIYEHIDEICKQESRECIDDNAIFDMSLLSDEIKQLIESLSLTQIKIICIILNQKNIYQQLEDIANVELSMPEILLDEINDISTQCIGDILIDTFGDEICIFEQYENKLKSALKTEG